MEKELAELFANEQLPSSMQGIQLSMRTIMANMAAKNLTSPISKVFVTKIYHSKDNIATKLSLRPLFCEFIRLLAKLSGSRRLLNYVF